MSIYESENIIEENKQKYFDSLDQVKEHLSSDKRLSQADAAKLRTECHRKGVAYFNSFERSIDEYGIPSFELNQDTRNRKIEDAMTLIPVIFSHWRIISKYSEKSGLEPIIPTKRAYSSIQRLIRRFHPASVTELKKEFMKNNLPTDGFDGSQEHSGWEIGSKKLTILQVVFGSLFCIASAIIAFKYENMTGVQYLLCRLFLAIGVTLITTALIEINMRVNWTIQKAVSIKAVGAIAFFIVIYFLNPPEAPTVNAPLNNLSSETKPE